MAKKSNVTYVVIKNYGVGISTWTSENKMFAFLLGGSKNNLTKTLNQIVIKRSLKLQGTYRRTVGKAYCEVVETTSDSAEENLMKILREKKSQVNVKKLVK